jgi:adenosylcobinamide kinase/adenosylcobinamide-phosphate guanylyltransferase
VEEEAISEYGLEGAALSRVTLVLGGARSGKSRFAEKLVIGAGRGTYIATAEARDSEMRARIDSHRVRRGQAWRTVEAPLDLVGALTSAEAEGEPVLVDCLTLWLSNLMEADRDIRGETDELISRLTGLQCPAVLVSNEVGQGIVPANPLARRFRDHAGMLNQAVAAVADRVFFVTAGIPAQLK